MAPKGRAANPIAKVLNEASSMVAVAPFGKKTAGKTSAEAVPYRKKS
jgi:hypothetical protein